MDIVISIDMSSIDFAVDFLLVYVCIGSVVLFPWSIYRASGNRCSAFRHMTSVSGCVWFFVAWALWPRLIYGMYKGW